MSPLSGNAEFDVADNGTLVYAPGGALGDELEVVWVDREGRSAPLLDTPRAYMGLRLSPDGRSIALDVDGANPNIWIYNLERGTLARMTFCFQNVNPP